MRDAARSDHSGTRLGLDASVGASAHAGTKTKSAPALAEVCEQGQPGASPSAGSGQHGAGLSDAGAVDVQHPPSLVQSGQQASSDPPHPSSLTGAVSWIATTGPDPTHAAYVGRTENDHTHNHVKSRCLTTPSSDPSPAQSRGLT